MREIKFDLLWQHDETGRIFGRKYKLEDLLNGSLILNVSGYGMPFVYRQYTGLKDKNGVEIYEGDILRLDTIDTKECVIFTNGGFMTDSTLTDLCDANIQIYNIFVIGNIYENHELLK